MTTDSNRENSQRSITSNDETYVPPAFRWTLLPPDHPERMRKVLGYINAGAAVGVGPLEWDTIKAALAKGSTSAHETPAPQAPIARLHVSDTGIATVVTAHLYAPGLPSGDFDVYLDAGNVP